jgi:chromosome segregation ATPase
MDRPSDNLLSRLEQSLRQSRAARMHLAARLRELEAEADSVRAELAEMDNLASQTEAAIYRLLSSVLNSGNLTLGLPSDSELEAGDETVAGCGPNSNSIGEAPADSNRQEQR